MPTPNVKDASLIITRALPTGASTVSSTAIDLGHGTNGQFAANAQLLIEAPVLTTGQLGDAATMKYGIQDANASDFSDARDLYPACLTQTGAGGAGAAAATKLVRLPTDVKRYVRLQATNSAAVNASAKSATLSMVF